METVTGKPCHHPPHVYLDGAWYLITASTLKRRRFLQPAGHKELLRDQLRLLAVAFRCRLAAWVILDNHYHILIRSHHGAALPRFVVRLHGSTAFALNGRGQARGRQVWHNYWDTSIRGEADFWTRLNYIHHNPVKHGYVTEMCDWPLSSYAHYLRRRGEEWMADVFRRYPVVDHTPAGDDF